MLLQDHPVQLLRYDRMHVRKLMTHLFEHKIQRNGQTSTGKRFYKGSAENLGIFHRQSGVPFSVSLSCKVNVSQGTLVFISTNFRLMMDFVS